MKMLILVIGVVSVMVAGVVSGETEIFPTNPTQFDVITITVSSTWGSSCVPNISNVDVDGNDIFFEAFTNYPPDIFCLSVITPWELTEDVGPLSAGMYTIHASANEYPVSDPYTFGVSDKRFVLSTELLGIPEGATATFTVNLLNDPLETVEATVAYQSGDPDITVASGAFLTFDSSNYSIPQTVSLAAAEDSGYLDDKAIIAISATDYVTSEVEVYEVDNDTPLIIYVDRNAPGLQTGTSWTNAFTDLHEALSAAETFAEIEEIRVAQGVYKPTTPGGNRNLKFQLPTDAAVRGGYAGLGVSDPNARDIFNFLTVLSGDLNSNDGPGFTDRGDNSYTIIGGRSTAVLDGFTITGAEGGISGGGIANGSANTTILNCTFRSNRSAYGGALRSHDGSPTFINCLFIDNHAKPNTIGDGGALYFAGNGSPTLVNCTLVANSANETGGGLCNYSPGTTVTNCIFWHNSDAGGSDESAQIHSGSCDINYCCIQGWTGTLGGMGNINTNPDFVDKANGDYHLLIGSPCIDAGDPCYVAGPDEIDLDGNPRIVDGDCDSTAAVDMGAYEFDFLSLGDFEGDDCDVDLRDFAVLADSFGQDDPAIDIAPYPAPDGIIDIKELLVLAEHWLEGTE